MKSITKIGQLNDILKKFFNPIKLKKMDETTRDWKLRDKGIH